MSVPREERLARQKRDHGRLEDTVYHGSGGGIGNGPTFYHGNRECSHLQRSEYDIHETTRRGAQRRWLAPCSDCIPFADKQDVHGDAGGEPA